MATKIASFTLVAAVWLLGDRWTGALQAHRRRAGKFTIYN